MLLIEEKREGEREEEREGEKERKGGREEGRKGREGEEGKGWRKGKREISGVRTYVHVCVCIFYYPCSGYR